MKHVIWLLTAFLLVACNVRKAAETDGNHYVSDASLLSIEREEGYTKVVVKDPWSKGGILHTYLLVPQGNKIPESLPEGTLVRTPLRKMVVYSSVHASLMNELGCANQIKGVCDADYMLLPFIQEGLKQGRVMDLGNSMDPDMERISLLKPDAILLSPYEHHGGYGKLDKLGIPLIECADYMETSPLGRAEWIKFYGLLTGKEDTADSIYAQTKASYDSLKDIVEKTSSHPVLLPERPLSGVWYVPGSESTLGIMYKDAGADYPFEENNQSGSVSQSLEQVFLKAGNADVWILKYGSEKYLTYNDLLKENAGYARIKAFKDRKVYGCNTLHTRFYEETPFHPDFLLRDLIKILHPSLLPDYTLRYYAPLR